MNGAGLDPARPADSSPRGTRQRTRMPLEEAAEWLGITPRHLRRLVAERKVSHYRIGGRLIFAVPDLEALLARCRRETLR
jgi:excisionase family DNA binding protein